ncbi:MAG: hypothetical protein IPK13_19360 [Deltaproteobacteria bacterium]|nr:hypothetical protein [Deltaproteobacteria bacterium]
MRTCSRLGATPAGGLGCCGWARLGVGFGVVSVVSMGMLALAGAAPVPAQPPPERGIALGLFSADPHFSYRPLIDEIAATGASHVSVAWVWWQDDVAATLIRPVAGASATDDQVLDAMQYARRRGLTVTAFPIVRLLRRGPEEWRGRIRPACEDDWWATYQAFILRAAELAAHAKAERLAIGSELLSRESMRERWVETIDRVRLQAPDLSLLYSANWDHYDKVSFWDHVDIVGLTAYWEVGGANLDASEAALAWAWRGPKAQIVAFGRRLGRGIVLTEVGYPSLDGGACWPWDETRQAPVDLEEQRRAYAAFVRVWSGTPELQGVYFWNWFGFGGKLDGGYTPRNKPAQAVIERWFENGRPMRERIRP